MSFEEIGRLTPAQLSAEFGGDQEGDAREVQRLLRRKRAKAFWRVCEAYGIGPRELAEIKEPDLAAMIRRALKVDKVETAGLAAQVREFIEDQSDRDEDEPIARPR